MIYDYYKILEIPRAATADDIKRAYRNKAKILHPDVNNSPKANEVFSIVNEAYETLSDDRKRYMHDLKLNYADTVKLDMDRKKHYYGTYSRAEPNINNRYSNNYNKAKNAGSEGSKIKTEEDYYKESPIIYNLFFISGMLVGFLILIVTITGTFRNYWPAPYGLISLAGIALIRDGWKGFLGKRTIASSIKKVFTKS